MCRPLPEASSPARPVPPGRSPEPSSADAPAGRADESAVTYVSCRRTVLGRTPLTSSPLPVPRCRDTGPAGRGGGRRRLTASQLSAHRTIRYPLTGQAGRQTWLWPPDVGGRFCPPSVAAQPLWSPGFSAITRRNGSMRWSFCESVLARGRYRRQAVSSSSGARWPGGAAGSSCSGEKKQIWNSEAMHGG